MFILKCRIKIIRSTNFFRVTLKVISPPSVRNFQLRWDGFLRSLGPRFNYKALIGRIFKFKNLIGPRFNYKALIGPRFKYKALIGPRFQCQAPIGQKYSCILGVPVRYWLKCLQVEKTPQVNLLHSPVDKI